MEYVIEYPFAFELRCSYALKENKICAGWKVINTDNKDMHFSIGEWGNALVAGEMFKKGYEIVFLA